jgi:dTDP-4-amino-4,6-dideoxygalactose transaminase
VPFEFDPAKSALTKADPNRSINFEDAQAIWIDQNHIELPLPFISEPCTAVIGKIGPDRCTAMVTQRGEDIHETKNLACGEGGVLLVNQERYQLRAEICREKDTDRSSFFRGEIAKYVWRDVGSSYLLGEMSADFLWAQFTDAQRITSTRRESWAHCYRLLAPIEAAGWWHRPIVPSDCDHNDHLLYIVLRPGLDRLKVLAGLKEHGVGALFHCQPLHTSPAGARFGRECGSMAVTDNAASLLIRLPFWMEISQAVQEQVVAALAEGLENHAGKS